MIAVKDIDIRILSRPEIDESRILDVYTNEDDEKCFKYEFFFNADLRQAINTGNFKVRMSVRKKAKTKRVSFFSDIDDISPFGLVESLYTKDGINKTKLRQNDKSGLIRRSFIDLTEYLPNKKIKNAKRLSDRALFGIIKKTEMFNVGDLQRQGINVNLPQRNLLRNRDVSSKTFIQNYQIAIKNGVDPSVLTEPRDSMTKADPRKRGTFTQKREKKMATTIMGARNTAMDILERATGVFNSISVSGLPSGDQVGLTVEKVDRVKIISKQIILKKKSLAGKNTFFIKLDVISPSGVIVQSLTMTINHLQNLKDYYVPRKIVKINANSSHNSPRRSINFGIVVEDQTISGYSLFQRKLSPTTVYSLTSFNSVGNTSLKKKSSKRSRLPGVSQKPTRSRFPNLKSARTRTLVPKGNCLYVTRVITTGQLGTQYGNFSQSSIKGGPILSNRLVFITKPIQEGIRISLISNVPDHVSGMCFVRRDISKGVTRSPWVKVLGKTSPLSESTTINVYASAFPDRSSQGFTVVDTGVKEGRTYEYRAKVYMRNGTSNLSLNSRYEKYVRPSGAVIASMSNFSYAQTTESGNPSISVSFDIDYSLPEDDADLLLRLLSDANLTSLYSDELEEIKSSLSNLVSFIVERCDVETGETEYLGIATSGTFTDGPDSQGTSPAMSREYIYRISPILVSPEDTVDHLSSRTSIDSSPFKMGSSLNLLRNPSSISSVRSRFTSESSTSLMSQADRDNAFIKSRNLTSISATTLRSGILSNMSSLADKTGLTLIGDYRTGDVIQKAYSTGDVSVKIKKGKITFGGHGGPIVRWSISSGTSDASRYIDYFVVIARKQGTYQVVGNCHASYTDATYAFIDYVSVGYVGQIDYYVVPVLLNGSISSRQKAGSTIMMDTNTKFRRGN